jgi:phosphoesterase RecJ-like protein
VTTGAAAAHPRASDPDHAGADAPVAVAAALVGRLDRDASVLLACHVNPDGDALGSMLGFGLGLRRLGFSRVRASFPEPFDVPEPFRFLPGLDLLVPPDGVDPPELGVSFDAASAARLGELAAPLAGAPNWLVLDHHASNPGFGTHSLVDPSAAATALVAARLLDRLGVDYDQSIATCLYVGLTTDTGSFRFDSTTPEVHALAARLVGAGAPPAEIALRLFDSRPYGALRLLADVLGRSQLTPGAAGGRGLVSSYALPEDLARHDQPAHVLESFVDILRTASDADVACLIKPASDGRWSVSLRSRGATDVGSVAVALGGGGHRLAAGFTADGDVPGVFAAVRARLDPPAGSAPTGPVAAAGDDGGPRSGPVQG